jgi:hypothetical protein
VPAHGDIDVRFYQLVIDCADPFIVLADPEGNEFRIVRDVD